MSSLRAGLALSGVLLAALPASAAESSLGSAAFGATETPVEADERRPPVSTPWRDPRLEGGVALGLSSESWSDSLIGTGPRLEVGIGVGEKLAFVLGESARFSLTRSETLRMMAFDLQTGLAYGAPYQTRTGFGAIVLVGAERLSTSTTIEGLMTWGVIGSVGVRASVAVASVDLWIGLDGMARSSTLETGRPNPSGVPSVSGLLSVGCFFPAFMMGRTTRNP